MTVLAAINGEHVPSRTLEEGYKLARQFDEELVVLHVMTQELFEEIRGEQGSSGVFPFAPGVSYGRAAESGTSHESSTGRVGYTIEDGERDAAGLGRDVTEKTLDDWRDVSFVGRVGDPVKEVLDEAKRRGARYIVVGGRKRSAVGKAVFGSITQSILLEADRPALVVMGPS